MKEKNTRNKFIVMRRIEIIILSIICLLLSTNGFAYDFEVDGIYFNITSNSEVEVTYGTNSGNSYSGDVIVPKSVSYSNKTYTVSTIGNFAFRWCENLTSITLPNSIKTIGSSSFAGSKKCKSINIPEGVVTIKDGAFADCIGLTSLVIPKSTTSIDDFAFDGCGCNLESISVHANNSYYDSRSNCNAIIRKSDMKLILGCKNSTIPDGVKKIGRWAFIRCIELKSIIFPSSLNEIGESAFDGCIGLTSLSIPSSVSNIHENAFYDCGSIETISVHSNNTYYDSRSNCNAIIKKSDNSLIRGCNNTEIPNNVVTIGFGAFSGCTDMNSITLPNSILSIKNYAFSGCSKLSLVSSEIDNPFDISENVFSNIASHATLQVPNGTKSLYQAFSGWTKNFKDIIEKARTVTFSIKATGNGSATYSGTLIKNSTQSFTVNEGISATISFTPDTGYKIKSLKLNMADVTASVVSNQYTISNINSDNTLEVEFEAITHTLTVKATGNGSATFNSTAVKGKSQAFTVNEGISATVTFTPDAGYRIKSVKLNTTDVTASIVSNQYTISNINSDNTLEVEFEAITHTLTIKATGNGSATFNSTVVKGKSQEFTVNEGTSATVTFTPDAGYRIKSVKLNTTDVTASVVSNQYTISSINSDNTLEVEFEAITHSLTIKATGNGSATFNSTAVKGKSQEFTVNEGASATVIFTPDAGNRIKSVKLNAADITSSIKDSQYTISDIKSDNTLEVEFEAIIHTLSVVAIGNGNVGYNGAVIRNQSQSYSVQEGSSVALSFTPDTGYRIASVKENSKDVTADVANNEYTISNVTENKTIEVTFEEIPPTVYDLVIKATGSGEVDNGAYSVRNKSMTFKVTEGTSVTVSFEPDEGYRLKSVTLDYVDIRSSLVGSHYTISKINANTTLEVVFEAIPNYALVIAASGNGSASYNGATIRNQSRNYTLREGTSATISFAPDKGYRIASVKVNSEDMTSQVANGQITIDNITQDTNVEVVFEETPPTTYSLNITAIGNGSVTYDENTIKGRTATFTVVEGSYVTIQISPDDGYRLESVTLDGKDVTSEVRNDQYTTSKLVADAALVIEFEAIPTFTLTIKSSTFGSVKYGDAVVTNQTKTFSVREGASATMTFAPDDNGRLQSITLNGTDITNQLVNGQYTINDMRADQSVEAEFVEDISKVTDAGVAYTVTSYDEQTVVVAAGNYGNVLTIPATFTAKDKTWTVIGIDEEALKNNTALAAIIWNPEVAFTAKVSNPNLLLYVKDAQYAPATIQNVVVDGQAENIVLVEAAEGNDFYCPQAFTAKRISYEHNYSMISGYKTCQGWETLVLPFDVSMITNAKGTEIVPYSTWQYGSNLRPFWLYEMTNDGWKAANGIKANTPYIIGMPNNEMYDVSYNQTGNILFVGNNVEVKASTEMTTGQHGNKKLVANYQNQEANSDILALNVSNEWCQNTATETEGSTFIRALRQVHPFEAYLTLEGSAAGQRAIPIFDNDVLTNIVDVRWQKEDGRNDEWYDLQGRKLQGEPKQNGIYIHNGKKVRK